MVMRYHWGLGVGHMYTRTSNRPESEVPSSTATLTLNQVPASESDTLQLDSSDEPDTEDDLDSAQENSRDKANLDHTIQVGDNSDMDFNSSSSGISSDDESQPEEGQGFEDDDAEMEDMYGEDYETETFSYN